MWRRPWLVTADTKSPAPQPGRNDWWRGSLRAGPGNGDGGGTWADNATAERREAGLPVAREVLLPRKRGVARYCATRTRLDVSGRSANPPRSGGRQRRRGKEEGEEPGRETSRGRRNWAV